MNPGRPQASFLDVFMALADDEASIASGIGPFQFTESSDPVMHLTPETRDSRGLRFRKRTECPYYARCLNIANNNEWSQFTCDSCIIGDLSG